MVAVKEHVDFGAAIRWRGKGRLFGDFLLRLGLKSQNTGYP